MNFKKIQTGRCCASHILVPLSSAISFVESLTSAASSSLNDIFHQTDKSRWPVNTSATYLSFCHPTHTHTRLMTSATFFFFFLSLLSVCSAALASRLSGSALLFAAADWRSRGLNLDAGKRRQKRGLLEGPPPAHPAFKCRVSASIFICLSYWICWLLIRRDCILCHL